MVKRSFHIVIFLLNAALIAFFVHKIGQIDHFTNTPIRTTLWQLHQLHTKQHENLLLIESGLVENYHVIEKTAEEIDLIAREIFNSRHDYITSIMPAIALLPLHQKRSYRHIEMQINAVLARYKGALRLEEALLEEYKHHHTVLTTSLSIMPSLAKSLELSLKNIAGAAQIRSNIAVISDDILLLYVSRDDTAIKDAKARLSLVRKSKLALAENQRSMLNDFIKHSELILRHLLRDKGLVRQITDDGITEHIKILHQLYNDHYLLIEDDKRIITGAVFLSVIILLTYIGTTAIFLMNRARQQAQSSSQLKSDFLASMSHEIRTPMNGIVGMTQLLLNQSLTDKQRDYAQSIRNSTENLMVIINDILDFSKIESGKLNLEFVHFNLHGAVEETVALFAPKATEKNLLLSLQYDDTLPKSIIADPVRVCQVINNFISNALKFTERGHIIVRVQRGEDQPNNKDHICIKTSVEDTGIGIAKSKQIHIFDKFTQADTSTTREFGGTGLGLAICRQLAQMMGGEIGLESVEGKGSTFWFTMMVQTTAQNNVLPFDQQITADMADATMHRTDFTGIQVLLVEDNLVNQAIAQEMLEELGCTVTLAENGQIAIDTASRGKFDFIFMDCQMPVMDGFEATRRLRDMVKVGEIKNLPIVALTANAMKGDKERCLAAGMDDHIAKPIRQQNLQQVMSRLLSASITRA